MTHFLDDQRRLAGLPPRNTRLEAKPPPPPKKYRAKASPEALALTAQSVGLDYKQALKQARTLGRTYAGSSETPGFDPDFESQLALPLKKAQTALSPDSTGADYLRDVLVALQAQWKAGRAERLKAVEEAEKERQDALRVLAADLFMEPGDAGFLFKKVRGLGYPVSFIQDALSQTSDPEKQERLQKMLALKAAPLKLDTKYVR